MATTSPYRRQAWVDRFTKPTAEALTRDLLGEARRLFKSMRKRLLDLDGVAETAAWYGASWKWSLEYRLPGRAEPVALLVPSPTDLQLAIPFQRDVVHELSRRPMKRAIRDGLELALDPFHTRWGVWSITVLLHEDLWKLIELKVSRTGTAKPPIQKRSRATVQAR